jgi:GR25 family glycosyltransferase involved in LPS biosynthesis
METFDIFNYVDLIYYINSSSRPEREESIKGELQKMKVDVGDRRIKRFEAVYPKQGEIPKEINGIKFDGSAGQWGCIKSHMGIWENIKDKKSGNVLVLEDDVEFNNDFCDLFPKVYNDIQKTDYQLFWFHNFTDSTQEKSRITKKYDSGLAKRNNTPFETHAYIINCSNINMYEHFNKNFNNIILDRRKAFEFAIDNLLMFCVNFKSVYVVTGFSLATQKRQQFKSDIVLKKNI